MSTDLKMALLTTACALAVIIAFSVTAILHCCATVGINEYFSASSRGARQRNGAASNLLPAQ